MTHKKIIFSLNRGIININIFFYTKEKWGQYFKFDFFIKKHKMIKTNEIKCSDQIIAFIGAGSH